MNETRILRCLINKAGGNSGAGSKTYRTTLPATWMKELGASEHDRELELTFDGEKIIIKKLKNRLTIGVQKCTIESTKKRRT